jgi:LysM repeat protein
VRTWTRSACVVLASSVLVILTAAGISRSARPAPATTRTASNTQPALTSYTTTSYTTTTPARITPGRTTAYTGVATASTADSTTARRAAPPARPAARYVVQPGDTLTGIAAALGIPGGWPALYAANHAAIGPDPGLIRAGTVLALPGRLAPARYTVTAGDTLTGIAAALGIPGGWPALYTANHAAIGPDPGLIRAGTVLAIPGHTPPAPAIPPGTSPASPAPPATPPARAHHAPPAHTAAPAAAGGMPRWLTTMLLAAALLIAAAFAAEPVLAIARRRRAAAAARTETTPADPAPATPAATGPPPAPAPAGHARIIMADFGRLIVTRQTGDGTTCVLRPPGTDPRAILRVARLVLPERSCRDLAGQLGLPDSWPIVMADHDQVVVTRHPADGTICVLRPPGTDPRAILRVARLVLPEEPYEELAGQLGVPAGWAATELSDAS